MKYVNRFARLRRPALAVKCAQEDFAPLLTGISNVKHSKTFALSGLRRD